MDAKQVKKMGRELEEFLGDSMTVLGVAGRESIYGHTSAGNCQTCLAKA